MTTEVKTILELILGDCFLQPPLPLINPKSYSQPLQHAMVFTSLLMKGGGREGDVGEGDGRGGGRRKRRKRKRRRRGGEKGREKVKDNSK